ncbi:MotA/TolQ/ExbB proton channel family protein [Bremerella sp. P1]|uniref:MotA/TolQ/ExbB proton channel family protein n=1 Tax=Bremerella sp. P1 TaxID=3026424 RepID=UPI002368B246|nr:MotA/TolQ/ExbB proton channel family protein [Bremerella sp. P1]WDI43736.1 MotA/TolQ/ExbB proton channel family protein [Bremerella sp. P1]
MASDTRPVNTDSFTNSTSELSPISWVRSDPEQRLAFRGGRFTRVNTWCALLLGVIFSTCFYTALYLMHNSYLAVTFTQRGPIPYCIAFFFFWSVAILILKFFKLRLQRRALQMVVVPENPEFVLSPLTVDDVIGRMYQVVDDPKHFTLLNRIYVALANLRNLGRVTDVDEILETQAGSDESVMETSYSLLQGFVWAIPVLGFIGTVQGLSAAIGGFGSVLATTEELNQVKDALKDVTGGLSVAFETTMQGLVAALIVQLLLTAIKKSEEEFLDSCSEYCVRNVVSRLRLMPYESREES